jgi:hypothetical protein
MKHRKELLTGPVGATGLLVVAACGSATSTMSPGRASGEPSTMNREQTAEGTSVEQVVVAMESAWSRNDAEGIVAVFAPDATLESPLVSRAMNRREGVCHGRDEILEVVRAILKRGRPWGGYAPPIVRGNTAAVEYTSPSSDGDHVSVDIIEVKNGMIQRLRAYVGWRAIMAQSPAR